MSSGKKKRVKTNRAIGDDLIVKYDALLTAKEGIEALLEDQLHHENFCSGNVMYDAIYDELVETGHSDPRVAASTGGRSTCSLVVGRRGF